jgi:hypothetical protein
VDGDIETEIGMGLYMGIGVEIGMVIRMAI